MSLQPQELNHQELSQQPLEMIPDNSPQKADFLTTDEAASPSSNSAASTTDDEDEETEKISQAASPQGDERKSLDIV